MKKLIFFMFFIFLIAAAWGQTTYTWVGGAGDWDDLSKWDDGGVPPATSFPGDGDIVIIENGSVVLNVSGITIESLTIGNGGELILNEELAVADDVTISGNGRLDTDGNTLTIGGDLEIDTSGTLILNGNVNVTGDVNVDSGTLSINGVITSLGNQTYSNAATLNGAPELISTGGSVQAAGVISGTGVTVNAASGITLSGNNQITASASLTNSGTGNISFNNTSTTLALTAVNSAGGTITVDQTGALSVVSASTSASGSISLTATGAVTQTGAITTTGTLTVHAGGAITLNTANNVGTLEITGAGGAVQFANNAAVMVAGVSGAGNNNVTITTATGAVTQTGAITTTGMLTVHAGGAITLTNTANNVGTLEITGAGGTAAFVNSAGLTLAEVSGAGSNNVSITTESGNLTTHGIHAGLVTLTASGNVIISEDIALPNIPGSLSVTGTAITINGNVETAGAQTYTGAVTLGGSLITHTLTSTTGTITLGAITGSGNSLTIDGNAILNGGNGIGALQITGNAEFDTTLLNATSVTVTGASTLNANVTTAGAQTYTGAVTLGGVPVTTHTLASTSGTVTLGAITGDGNSLTITGNAILNGGSGIDVLSVSGTASFNTAPLSAASVTVTGASTINANITTTGAQTYTGAVTLGGVPVTTHTLTSTTGTVTLGAITGDGNSLTINGNAVLNGGSGIDALQITGTATLNANVTTVGNQSYSTVTFSGSAPRTLTSSSGSIEAESITNDGAITITANTGKIAIGSGGINAGAGAITLNAGQEITSDGQIATTASLTASASGGITLDNEDNSVASINLTNTGTGNISYTNARVGGLTVTDAANSDGKVTITELTGNMIITAITSNTLVLEAKGSVTITNAANVTINDSTTSLGHGHDGTAAVYIKADILTITGSINLTDLSDEVDIKNRVCFEIENTISYPGGFYHWHTTKHIVYRSADPDPDDQTDLTPADYFYVDASSTLSDNYDLFTSGDKNIYLIDVDDGNSATRILNLSTVTGFIEIRGNYKTTTTGELNFSTASVRLNGAIVTLVGDFDTKNAPLTILGTSASSVEAENIMLNGGITALTPENLTLAANDSIFITGAVGTGSDQLGNIEVTKGNVNFSGAEIFAASYTQNTGNANLSGDVAFNTSGVITLPVVTGAGNLAVNNGGSYTQNGEVTANSLKQTGTGAVSLGANINVTDANRADAVISFNSPAGFTSNLTFSTPATGGVVEFKQGIVGAFSLTLNGGSSDSGYLELSKDSGFLGDVIISKGSYVKVSSGKTIRQTNGATLRLEAETSAAAADGAVLDTSAGSWYMGSTGTFNNGFSGNNGTLALGSGSKLIGNNVNLTQANLKVNNTGWAAIGAKGNVEIGTDTSIFTGDFPQLIIEMSGNGAQTLTASQTLGSLHIGENSQTTLSTAGGTIYFRGRVKISSVNAPAGLDAGDHNIVMYAGLTGKRDTVNHLHIGTNDISYARWEINAPLPAIMRPPFSSTPNMSDFVFRQNPGKTVELKKDPADASGNPVFFEIVGNTMWHELKCVEPGAVVQFSRAPDHHTILESFYMQGNNSGGDDNSNYVTITRLTEDRTVDSPLVDEYSTKFPYISSPLQKPPLTSSGASVGDLGDYAFPVYFPPADLKNAPEQEQRKYWNINLVSGSRHTLVENFKYVKIYFSHAYNQRIPIATSSMFLDALPYYMTTSEFGYFNFDWIELRKILYSFTEDTNGDGRLDRIRVQTNVELNGNFKEFDVKVEGYEIDRGKGERGFELVSKKTESHDDDDSFYIYLIEKPEIDGGSTPMWSVTRNDESLLDGSERLIVGEPGTDIEIEPFDTIPPRIAYSVTLPDHPQTYVKISEPVVSEEGVDAFISFNGSSYLKGARAVETTDEYNYNYPSEGTSVHIPPANIGYLLDLDSPFNIEELSAIGRITNDATAVRTGNYFQLDNMIDQGQRAMAWNDPAIDPDYFIYYKPPKYPLNWKYTEYVKVYGNKHLYDQGLTNFDNNDYARDINNNPIDLDKVFLPPNKMLTVEMMQNLASNNQSDNVKPEDFAAVNSVIRRITDALVSIPPDSKDSGRYFVWPVWTRYQNPANPGNISPSDEFYKKTDADNGIIWKFDGTEFLEARDIELQARMNSKLTGFDMKLFWAAGVGEEFRNPMETAGRGKGSGGLWLPDLNDNPLYYYAPLPIGVNVNSQTAKSASLSLYNFGISKDAPGFNSGEKFDFIFRLTNIATNVDFFTARLDIASGSSIPENWYSLIRPFSFDIQNVRLQRGGVTVLNNVINSNNREIAFIRYHLVRSGRITIQVYTLDGTLVKSLRRNEHREAGEWTDTWDGTNNGGRAVARGMYFVRVVGPDIDEIRKIMVIK